MGQKGNEKSPTVKEIATAAAKQAVKELANENATDNELAILQQDEEAQTIGFDVFDFCDQKQKEEGLQIQYQIKKNGEVTCTKYHPYSWDKLQKEFKNGHYQVVAKNAVTKQFIRSQSQAVQDPIFAKEAEELKFQFGAPPVQPQPPQAPQLGIMEILAMTNQASEKARAEARESAREQATSSQASMTNFIEMMKISQTQNQTLFSELAKAQSSSSQAMMEYTNKMFEKMNDKFERIVEKISQPPVQKEKDMSILEVLRLQESAQEKGFALFEKMQQLAELKAEEKAELLEEVRGSSGSEKKSMTDTLIETVLPSVAAAMAGNQNQQRPPVQPRRQLPPGQYRRQPIQASAPQNRPRVAPPQNATPKAATTPQGQGDNRPNRGSVGGNNQTTTTTKFGLPTLNQTPVVENKKPIDIKVKIENILVPIVTELLLNLTLPAPAADKMLTILEQNNINRKLFLQYFKEEDILGIVTRYNLPKEAEEWFKEIYANINSSARNDARETPANEGVKTI